MVSDDQRALIIKVGSEDDDHKPSAPSNSGSFLSFDSFLENISPAALPTMLIGKLMNVTSLFQQSTNNGHTSPKRNDELPSNMQNQDELVPDDDDESDSSRTKQQPDQDHSSLLSSLRLPLISSNRDVSNPKKNNEYSVVSAPTKSPDSFSTSLASKLKRNSLFFNNKSDLLVDTVDPTPSASSQEDFCKTISSPSQQDNNSDVGNTNSNDKLQVADTNNTRHRSSSYSFSMMPRAIKNQVLRSEANDEPPKLPVTDNTNTPSISTVAVPIQQDKDQNSNTTTTHGRHRNSSLSSSIRQHISPFYLYNKMCASNNNSNETIANNNTSLLSSPSGDISLLKHSSTNLPASDEASTTSTNTISVTKRKRAKSVLNKLAPSNTDYYYNQQNVNENQHRHPRGPVWINGKMIGLLAKATRISKAKDITQDNNEENSEDDKEGISASMDFVLELQTNKVMKDPKLREDEQRSMNEHLNANFPMLLKTEEVEAVFKASFWRTIPYSGKIYMTNHYFCFNSKILAGHQKLIVPWQDIIQINKLKSKSYYLMHGMSMIVKDMTDEIYFDFISIELRDHCYSICQLKSEEKVISDASSIISNNSSISASTKSLLLDRPDHVSPPTEYSK
ncbi:MAG: hypothetical protein EXX96DRAFT_280320 [Benjaminiella poitrasii]|nr:MAG: hypothetical protein EXX96DRAFT_280320 [Benjaminiella poitrasii]